MSYLIILLVEQIIINASKRVHKVVAFKNKKIKKNKVQKKKLDFCCSLLMRLNVTNIYIDR